MTLPIDGNHLRCARRVELYQIYFVVLAISIAQLMVSPIWLRFFLVGPLEWLWRSLTYWKLQPFMRLG